MPRYTKKYKEIITQQMRKDIHDTCLEILKNDGWKALTTEKIAKKMNVSRGVLYNYFKNKEEMVHSLLKEMFDKQSYKLLRIANKKIPCKNRLSEICDEIAKDIQEGFKLYHQLFNNVTLTSATENHVKNNEVIIQIISEVISEGIKANEFSDVDPNAAATLFFGGLQELCLKSLITEKEINYQPMFEIFLSGISVTK